MGKIEGIKIQNYGVLKDIVLGKTRTRQNVRALGNLVAVIGPSGNGKSTLADAFGFIADCLEMGVEAACDANNRGGYEKLISQGATAPILFELYYRENRKDFEKILQEIQSKLPGIEKIEPQKFENGQMMLRFYEKGFERPFYSQRMSGF